MHFIGMNIMRKFIIPYNYVAMLINNEWRYGDEYSKKFEAISYAKSMNYLLLFHNYFE